MADSIRVSLPPSGDEADMGAAEEPPATPGLDPGESQLDGGGGVGIGEGGSGTGSQRPQKRRRIPVACGACRSKKSRVRLTLLYLSLVWL